MKITLNVDRGLLDHVTAIGKALYGSPEATMVALIRNDVQRWHSSPNLSMAAAQHMPPRLRKVWTAINQRRAEKAK